MHTHTDTHKNSIYFQNCSKLLCKNHVVVVGYFFFSLSIPFVSFVREHRSLPPASEHIPISIVYVKIPDKSTNYKNQFTHCSCIHTVHCYTLIKVNCVPWNCFFLLSLSYGRALSLSLSPGVWVFVSVVFLLFNVQFSAK